MFNKNHRSVIKYWPQFIVSDWLDLNYIPPTYFTVPPPTPPSLPPFIPTIRS